MNLSYSICKVVVDDLAFAVNVWLVSKHGCGVGEPIGSLELARLNAIGVTVVLKVSLRLAEDPLKPARDSGRGRNVKKGNDNRHNMNILNNTLNFVGIVHVSGCEEENRRL